MLGRTVLTHNAGAEEAAPTVFSGVTVTCDVLADAEQPRLLVAVTVYVMFAVGLTPVGF